MAGHLLWKNVIEIGVSSNSVKVILKLHKLEHLGILRLSHIYCITHSSWVWFYDYSRCNKNFQWEYFLSNSLLTITIFEYFKVKSWLQLYSITADLNTLGSNLHKINRISWFWGSFQSCSIPISFRIQFQRRSFLVSSRSSSNCVSWIISEF